MRPGVARATLTWGGRGVKPEKDPYVGRRENLSCLGYPRRPVLISGEFPPFSPRAGRDPSAQLGGEEAVSESTGSE